MRADPVTDPAAAYAVPAEDLEDLEDDELIDDSPEGGDDGVGGAGRRKWRRPSAGRWILFAVLAVGILLADQATKAWITGNLVPGGAPVEVLGSWLRFMYGVNSGILFGMLPQSGPAFAVVSMAVVGLIVLYHAKVGRGLVTTIALGLLLGGALGNLVDRLHYGAVVDWVDMGIGGSRFWTYNIGDAAITTAICLLIVMAVFPKVGEWAPDD
jgi:signal peptidase II